MTDKRRAWAVTLAAFLAGIAVTINQFKVPPVFPVLMAEMHVDMTTAGWLMSVFSVAAVLLSIPAAFALNRLGPKIPGLVALGCVLAGSALGAVAGDATVLLISRMIEGISVGLVAVVSPALISLWFEPRDRGLPMGIWAAWVPLGNAIMFNLAYPLQTAFGWRAIWWFGALLALVVLVVFGLVVSVPQKAEGRSKAPPAPSGSAGRMLLSPAGWLLPLAFGTFTFSLIGYNTWAPSFLTDALNVEASAASFYASLLFVAGIVANVTAGWAINRARSRYGLLTAIFFGSGVLFFWGFRLGSVGAVVPYMLGLGFASNFIPTSLFTLAPETATRPEFTGLALATLNMGANLGILIGPPVLGSIVARGNWTPGSICLVIVMGAGTMVSMIAWKRWAGHDRSH
jgi:predicted MFS family arabinose efflux permease